MKSSKANKKSEALWEKVQEIFGFSIWLTGVLLCFLFARVWDVSLIIAGFIIVHCCLNYFFDWDTWSLKKDRINPNLLKVPKEEKWRINCSDRAKVIAKDIIESSYSLHIIVGSSGSGKSVLIREFMGEQYGQFISKEKNVDKVVQVIITSYSMVDDTLLALLHNNGLASSEETSCLLPLKGVPATTHLIIVFDQFEKIFLMGRDLAVQQLHTLWEIFNYCDKENSLKNIDCIISMRKEWYFNLKYID
ncbi:MAG: hypothetical protein ACOYNC_19370 [Bacteroidales bacterium]